jgi:eukaryotic translation initiation factor 2C
VYWGSPVSEVEDTLTSAFQEVKQKRGAVQIIACLLPNTSEKLYAEIKRVTDTVLGIPSQW